MLTQIFFMNELARAGKRMKPVACEGLSDEEKAIAEVEIAKIYKESSPYYDVDEDGNVPCNVTYWILHRYDSKFGKPYVAYKHLWTQGSFGADSLNEILDKIRGYEIRPVGWADKLLDESKSE